MGAADSQSGPVGRRAPPERETAACCGGHMLAFPFVAGGRRSRGERLLVVKRARVHGPLLAGFLGTALLLCGVAVAVVGLVDTAVDDGARAVASQRAGADLALRVSLGLADDAARQDEQVRAALDHSLAGLSAPVAVDRTVAGEAT